MAPNPVIIPRHQSSSHSRLETPQPRRHAVATLISLTILAVSLATTRSWSRSWISSGAGVESLLLIYGSFNGALIDRDLHLWILLAVLNLVFALASTSWLLRPMFTAACYLAILLTCFFQFPTVSYTIRNWLRKLLHETHLFRDKIGFFSLPALQIDTQVNGLFVVRGITVSLLDLTIEAHGLELGLRLNNDVELALCADHLSISLFRHIDITDVYGNLKLKQSDMSFRDPDGLETEDLYPPLFESGILQLATAQSNSRQRVQPKDRDRKPISDYEEEASIRKEFQDTAAIPLDDVEAEDRYNKVLKEVDTGSQIYVARRQIEQADPAQQPRNEREMRQAVCAKLQDVPSVSHTPTYAVSVSVLQTIFPRVRRFLHRLPFLLRLLLNQLSYLHPINISSISIAGPGERLKGLLHNHLLKDQASHGADMRQLEDEMSSWLASATFCLEIVDLAALGHVPCTSSGDITTYLRSANVSVYRTPLESNTVRQVTHIGGADATFVMPAFLLPHHEHCLPPSPIEQDGEEQTSAKLDLQGAVPAWSSEGSHDGAKPDETELIISVHASLPTHFDQSLLDFAATLVKATKLIDLETLFERETAADDSSGEQSNTRTDGLDSESSAIETDTDVNTSADGLSSNPDPRNTGSNLTKLVSRARQSVKDGIKKGLKENAVGDKVNDRWIAKTVGRIAARLEQAQGDIGYTTALPLSLQPYRSAADLPSKILP